MDLTHWAYQAAAITTTLVGAAWTVAKLYFGVRKLHRESRVADAKASVEEIRAEIAGVKLRESQPEISESQPKTPSLPESQHTLETIPSLFPSSDTHEKGRGSQ